MTPQLASVLTTADVSGSGSALDRDLRGGLHGKAVVDGGENPLQLFRGKNAGRAAAQVDGVHLALEASANLLGNLRGPPKFALQMSYVALQQRRRKHARGEVAEAALAAAKRHRDINPQRHAIILEMFNF